MRMGHRKLLKLDKEKEREEELKNPISPQVCKSLGMQMKSVMSRKDEIYFSFQNEFTNCAQTIIY